MRRDGRGGGGLELGHWVPSKSERLEGSSFALFSFGLTPMPNEVCVEGEARVAEGFLLDGGGDFGLPSPSVLYYSVRSPQKKNISLHSTSEAFITSPRERTAPTPLWVSGKELRPPATVTSTRRSTTCPTIPWRGGGEREDKKDQFTTDEAG